MQDHIFVLLMQTGTSVAKVLQFFTRKPYNHASVALDLTLEEMYSFCRNHIHFPLPAGFNQEIVGEGTLGRFLVIPCEIYAIPVTKEKKQEFEQNLAYFKNHRSMFFTMCWGSAQLSCGFAGRENTSCTVLSSWQPCLHSPAFNSTSRSPCTHRTTCGIFQMPISSIGAN